ncbi:MAG: hypothetical protein JWO44_486 [Bacteroidetes bacterium]|jgi:hypothetical protein|nr:hypothetical protein [Bacteroidota bacterium]
MKKTLTLRSLVAAALVTASTISAKAQTFTENFDDITTLAAGGWVMTNASVAVGSTNWFQGTSVAGGGPFDAFNGAANAYIGANYNNTGSTGTISNWLMTPNRTFRNGDVISFYTRKVAPDSYADRLEVRLSTNGASTIVGTGVAVGDYTTLLLSVNPTLALGVYPTAWTLYTVTISGLPAPTSGRIGFRYYVTGAGFSGTNSDYIGIDNVVYTPYVCPVVSVSPTSVANGTAGTAYSQSLSQTGALGAPTYAVTAGALPAGLTLSASGTISGTPTATGTFNFTVSAGDASGCVGSTSYSITIVCPTGGAALTVSPATVCSNAGIISIGGGSPAGGVYSGTGVSGTSFDPASGTQTLTYTLTDAYGCVQTANNTITVDAAPTVGSSSDAPGNTACEGTAVTLTGSGADTYTWDNGVTDGVAFTPPGTSMYTVTGTTTATGCTNTEVITITVNSLPAVVAGSDAPSNAVCDGSSVTLTGSGADTYTWDNSVTDGVAFTPTGTATYMVTGTTTATGCANTDMITITVNPLPAVGASSDASGDAICDGFSVTLSGSGADTYTWDNSVTDGVAFTPAGTMMYMVTGTTTATGCTNTGMITITVNPLPTVDLASFPLYCIYSGVISLSSGTPAGGTYAGTGVSGSSFDTGIGAGTYAVSYDYTDANGCTGTDTENLVVDLCTTIADAAASEAVTVYPNPSTGTFTISYNQSLSGDLVVRIMDVQGKVVAAEKLSRFAGTYTHSFDLGGYDKGVYFLEVTGTGNKAYKKIVLQ